MTTEALEPGAYRDFVRRALAEDLGWGDATVQAVVAPEARAEGVLLARSAGVVAGLEVALEVFRQLDPAVVVTVQRRDGDPFQAGDRIANVAGLAAPMLTAERTALNFLRHLSGIATLTRKYMDACGGRVPVADTRQTLPMLRLLQKYAVRVGGGINGRFALDEGIIIKTNHLRVAGGITAAIKHAHKAAPDTPIEVEINGPAEAGEALDAGAGVILYAGASLDDLRAIVDRCRNRARVEVSGPIAVDRIDALAATGADFVSIAALTDSAPAADITFELRSV